MVATSNDTSVLQLLLEHGASITYNDGAAFIAGVASGDILFVRLLLNAKYLPARVQGFRALFHDSKIQSRLTSSSDFVEIAGELLSRGVD